MLSRGAPAVLDEEGARVLREVMAQPEIALSVDVRRGSGDATLFFSDLTHQYVTFNAEYTT